MDNNLPISLFQHNANNMQVNNDEIDEEEENADQIRRNIELAENLDKYLQIEDDIADQTSLNESQYDCGDQPRYENELCRLRNELISKNNEVETLKHFLSNERRDKDAVYNDSQKKLRIFEAEKERAIMTKNQTHDLLVESKTELSNLQNYTEELKQKLDSVEDNNSKLMIELQQTKTMLSDLQHQHHHLELDMRHKTSSRIDITIKQLQEKHNAQVEIMQQQIDSLSSKLNDKETEIKNLSMRYKELERSREVLLIEKSEVINQLANKLENQQTYYISNTCLSEENLELQKKTMTLLRQNEALEKRVLDLTNKLETTRAELNSVESVTHVENSTFLHEKMVNKKHKTSTPLPATDFVKNEFQRGLENQKTNQIEEIKQLKNELIQKNEELQQLRNNENKGLIASNEFQEMQHRLMSRIKNLEDELVLHKNSDGSESVSESSNTKILLQKELTSALEDCEKVKRLYIEACDEKEEILKELRTLQNTSVNNKPCLKCQEKLTDLKKYQTELLEKQSEANNYLKEIEVLRQELYESKTSMDLLNNKLVMQEHQNDLINELKLKAEHFEQFMKSSRINSPSTKLKENANTAQTKESDMEIKEEMARRYAVEIRANEKSHKDQMYNYEQLQASLRHELNNMNTHLQVKTDEMESLKAIVLKERAKMQEIIAIKEESAKKVLNRQTEILNKCRIELQLYQTKMASLIKELKEKTGLVNEERESIVLLQQQIVETKTSFQRREADLLETIDNIKQDNINKISHIKEKYQSAKKTAQHYKVYSEEKEQHMLKEYNRLKEGYKEAVQKLEKRLSSLLSDNEEKYNQRLREVRMDYCEKLNSLKTDKDVSSTSEIV